MWKMPENDRTPIQSYRPDPAFVAEESNLTPPSGPALLGRSLVMEGTITGGEDLLVEGRIKGTVNLKEHTVIVGKHGKVEGDIIAKVIMVEGEVMGNIRASERASIRQSGFVKGNVSAPRVLVEDGARLKGSIDVDSETEIRELDVDLKQLQVNARLASEADERDEDADEVPARLM